MSADAPTEGSASSQPAVPKVDDSKVTGLYANFCRVTGTPEELIVDFGLNTQMRPTDDQPIALTQRVVMNYFSAKRLLQALTATVARHEQAFGTLETNVQRRLK